MERELEVRMPLAPSFVGVEVGAAPTPQPESTKRRTPASATASMIAEGVEPEPHGIASWSFLECTSARLQMDYQSSYAVAIHVVPCFVCFAGAWITPVRKTRSKRVGIRCKNCAISPIKEV